MIGLSINKNLKLEKEKEKKSSASQSRVLLYSPLIRKQARNDIT